MGKSHVTISIDEEVHKKTKELGLNLSGEVEKFLRNRSSAITTNIPSEDGDVCGRCGKKEVKATINNLDGLTWLSPDDMWICKNCLETEIRQVIVSLGSPKAPMSKEKRAEIMDLAREFVNIPEISKDIAQQVKEKLR